MNIIYVALAAMALSLALVFNNVFQVTKSFRKAFIAALIVFKISVILLAAYGVDKTLFYITFRTKRGIYKVGFNASTLALFSSFMLLLGTIFSDYFLSKLKLPESIRRGLGYE